MGSIWQEQWNSKQLPQAIVFLKIKLMRHGRPRSRSSGGRKDRDRHPRINHKQEALRVSLTLVRTACF